jgi:hypothetical protein
MRMPLYAALASLQELYYKQVVLGHQVETAAVIERRFNYLAAGYIPRSSHGAARSAINVSDYKHETLTILHVYEHGDTRRVSRHVITVKPSLITGIHISISGRLSDGVKQELVGMYAAALNTLVDVHEADKN